MVHDIVLAEDDRGTALLVKTQLERYGYNVMLANNGIEALALLLSQPVDLLITDVVMPQMDGVDLYLELKKDPRTNKLPVIIVTDKQMFKDSFSSLGVDHFVPKTSDISLLMDKIREIEKSSPRLVDYRKVLIGGTQSSVTEQMKVSLRSCGCLVSTVDNSADLFSKVFMMTPHVILLDVLMKDYAMTSEVVHALKSFRFLNKTIIMTYSSLAPDHVGIDPSMQEIVEEEVQLCQAAGADKYIGRFSRLTFLESMKESGITSVKPV
ncbi:MAG: response regulator [Candidatus Omnitrophica bacterium]|nr:response regulator [Candidatus Omnitrophota bacterium]